MFLPLTLGTVSAVWRGIRLFSFHLFPKIKLGSKLIDHRPNKLKGVSSEVWCIHWVTIEEDIVADNNGDVGRHRTLYRLFVPFFICSSSGI
jgi:hypothetical protein